MKSTEDKKMKSKKDKKVKVNKTKKFNMHFFRDAKIKNKLYMAFGFIIVFGLIAWLSVLAVTTHVATNVEYIKTRAIVPNELVNNMVINYENTKTYKYLAINSALANAPKDELTAYTAKARESYTAFSNDVDKYIEYYSQYDDESSMAAVETATKIQKSAVVYGEQLESALYYAENEKSGLAYEKNKSSKPISDAIEKMLYDQISANNIHSIESIDLIVKNIAMLTAMIVVMVSLLVLCCLVVAKVIATDLNKKISHLLKCMKHIADGNFSDSFALPYNDELGELSREVARTAGIIEDIVSDVHDFSVRQQEGYTKQFIDHSKYNGEYNKMVVELNDSFRGIFNDVQGFIDAINNLTDGDFDTEYEKHQNDKIVIDQAFDNIKDKFSAIGGEIDKMVSSLSVGDFTVHANSEDFDGQWKEIVEKLNVLIGCFKEPIDEARSVLNELSEGNLSAKVEGNYQGSFNEIKKSVNATSGIIKSIIDSMAYVLNEIAHKNLDLTFDTEFPGEYDTIKVSIQSILYELNKVLGEFKVGADEVATGGSQISSSSIHLSERATEQANSIEELNSSIADILEKTKSNTELSDKANKISVTSLSNANQGDEKMQQMVKAMDDISQSSSEIANIIKVIDDIAFQTNLLALNAAVEAARAGAHGKGFAVVAEEVRQLASRSSNAAKETNLLINKSITSVSLGSELATDTAEALNKIVNNVAEVSKLINSINESSNEQLTSIGGVSENLGLIENTVASVLAASEEGVSTAEELSSQSQVLNEYISEFKLNNK